MPNISSLELIAQFQTALRDGWGYIYGASGEIWMQAQQLRTPLSKITSTGEIEQRFRLN